LQVVFAYTVGFTLQIQDAQAAMRLYTMHRKQWEKMLKSRLKKKPSSADNNNSKPLNDWVLIYVTTLKNFLTTQHNTLF